MLIDAYFELIIVEVSRNVARSVQMDIVRPIPDIVRDTIRFVEEHLTEDITIKVLETHLFRNGIYIGRCFKNAMGISLKQYIITKKVMLACELLQVGHSPGDVCFETGFKNYTSFSRVFSQKMGVSPKRYQAYNNWRF